MVHVIHYVLHMHQTTTSIAAMQSVFLGLAVLGTLLAMLYHDVADAKGLSLQ